MIYNFFAPRTDIFLWVEKDITYQNINLEVAKLLDTAADDRQKNSFENQILFPSKADGLQPHTYNKICVHNCM